MLPEQTGTEQPGYRRIERLILASVFFRQPAMSDHLLQSIKPESAIVSSLKANKQSWICGFARLRRQRKCVRSQRGHPIRTWM